MRRSDSRGQVLPLFALTLVAILALTGLGLDTANAFLERRDAQGAADLAALAGARFLPGEPDSAIAKAKDVGEANGYTRGDVLVTTPYQDDTGKIKVVIDSRSSTFFLPVVGVPEFDVNAAAGAVAGGASASCTFCSLNGTDKNHTLLLKNGATLRVDGDIVGDAVSPPAYISAKSISVAGGWETHDDNVVMADGTVWPDYSTLPQTYKSCPFGAPNPPSQTQQSNVCIHVPKIVDPLNNPAFPQAIVPSPEGRTMRCPTRRTVPLAPSTQWAAAATPRP